MNSVLIGDRYKIDSTKIQITLSEKTNKQQQLAETLIEQAVNGTEFADPEKVDEEGWRPIGYFATFQNCLHFLIEHDIKGQNVDDFKVLVFKVMELHLLLDAADIGFPKLKMGERIIPPEDVQEAQAIVAV